MKTATILSGDKASGKTWISEAIANQYNPKKVLRIESIEVMREFLLKGTLLSYLAKDYRLVIIEEVFKPIEIHLIHTELEKIFPKEPLNPFSKDGFLRIRDTLSLVFITQLPIRQDQFSCDNFRVINCNNNY